MAIIILLSLSAVSAADNATDDAVAAGEIDDGLREDTSDYESDALEADNNQEVLSDTPGTFSDLRNDIAGDIVELGKDYSFDPNIDTGQILISSPKIIDGKGHTINGNGLTGIFAISASDVYLLNITFVNANNRAIYVESGVNNIYVYNSSFYNNTASGNGGAIYWLGRDGAIHDCYFENNSANGYGGAVCFESDGGDIESYNCIFINNSAKSGGAIYLDTPYYFPHLHIKNHTFESNTADDEGGAIYSNGLIRMFSSYLNGNNATKGSAIFKTGGSEMSIEDTEFGRNRADSKDILFSFNVGDYYAPANVSFYVLFLGFDNIANAIWNDGDVSTIRFRNISCEFSIDGVGRSLETFNDFPEYAIPTEDCKYNSSIWQNYGLDWEDAQLVDFLVKNEKNETIYCLEDGVVVTDNTKRGSRSSLPDDSSLIVTDPYGYISVKLTNLKAGTYTVEAKHRGDDYYTEIIAETVEFTVLGDVKLEINKTANATVVGNNTLVEFTITVNNTGSADATDVYVRDGLPSGFDFVNATEGYDTTYSCWMVDELEAGESISFTIIGRSVEVGNWTNYAYASCEENDTLVSDTFKVEIVPTDLTIVKSASPTNVTFGENVTFTVTVTNNGQIDVSDVNITDVLDSAFSFDGTSTSIPCKVLGQKLVWNIGDLASKASKTIEFTVTAIAVGNFTNEATVTCRENATGKSNKTDVTVNPAPSSVRAEDVSVNYGDAINVDYDSVNATYVTYEIYDEDGNLVDNGTVGPSGTVNIQQLAAGNYSVNWTTFDENHTSSTNTSTIEVKKILPPVNVDAPTVTVGEDGVIIVTVPEDATGTVTIEVEGKNYTESVIDGIAVFIVPGLKAGLHNISAYYSGDDKYLPNNTTGTIEVLPQEDNNVTPQDTKPPVKSGLARHETANPIAALLMVLAILAINIKRRK